jgi:hypothetical protein
MVSEGKVLVGDIIIHIAPGVQKIEQDLSVAAINSVLSLANAKITLQIRPLDFGLKYIGGKIDAYDGIVRVWAHNNKDKPSYSILLVDSPLATGWNSLAVPDAGCLVSTAISRTWGYGPASIGTRQLEDLTFHEFGHVLGMPGPDRAKYVFAGGAHCANEGCVMQQGPGNWRDFAMGKGIKGPLPFCGECLDDLRRAPIPRKLRIVKIEKPKISAVTAPKPNPISIIRKNA